MAEHFIRCGDGTGRSQLSSTDSAMNTGQLRKLVGPAVTRSANTYT